MRVRSISQNKPAAATSASSTASVALWVAAETAISAMRPMRSAG